MVFNLYQLKSWYDIKENKTVLIKLLPPTSCPFTVTFRLLSTFPTIYVSTINIIPMHLFHLHLYVDPAYTSITLAEAWKIVA